MPSYESESESESEKRRVRRIDYLSVKRVLVAGYSSSLSKPAERELRTVVDRALRVIRTREMSREDALANLNLLVAQIAAVSKLPRTSDDTLEAGELRWLQAARGTPITRNDVTSALFGLCPLPPWC
jgi:hypothetical protein